MKRLPSLKVSHQPGVVMTSGNLRAGVGSDWSLASHGVLAELPRSAALNHPTYYIAQALVHVLPNFTIENEPSIPA